MGNAVCILMMRVRQASLTINFTRPSQGIILYLVAQHSNKAVNFLKKLF